MNIFKQYGIKEVADVVFYSITRVGDEEFYIPVLYFDTLKITSLDKNVNTVIEHGGKGNGKIISWNYEKNSKLKLEDALFSQMSLNTFLNGRVMAKMSAWTSAIAKLNVANKYGQKHYSVKAFPSPELTEEEWEIIYRCAQKAGFDPRTGYSNTIGENRLTTENHTTKFIYTEENDSNTMVAENRWLLKDRYYRRTQKTPHSRNIAPYFDYDANNYESVSIIIKDIDRDKELKQAKEVYDLPYGSRWGDWRDLVITYKEVDNNLTIRKVSIDDDEFYPFKHIVMRIHFSFEKRPEGIKCLWCYISADNMSENPEYGTLNILRKLFTGYNKDDTGLTPSFHIGNEFFLNHLFYYIFPNYLEDAIGDLCWCDMNDKICPAMPQEVINYIAEEITDFSKTGYFENDLYEAEHIDRFEKCVVKNRKGLKIDLIEQMKNIKSLYKDEEVNFTVFYDAKTMLPFMGKKQLDEKILSQKCVRIRKFTTPTEEDYLAAIKSYLRGQYDDDWVDSLTENDYVINSVVMDYSYAQNQKREYQLINPQNSIDPSTGEVNYISEISSYLIYFNIIKRDYINLKYGTVYYKRSRTINDDVNDITFIGTDLSIDTDTFPGEFMIVGETYIREQQTGKDRRLQLVINRAAISASTKIQLQAAGGPTTFSIDVDILKPKIDKKSMFELIQYDVEEDKQEGGFKIIPQNKRHSCTSTIQVYEEIVGQNIEIY